MTDAGDGIDEELSSAARIAITVAAQMAQNLSRAREEIARDAQRRSEQEQRELQARFSAERDAAGARLAVVERPEFWETSTVKAQAAMYETAEQWKDLDPRAQAASETIAREFQQRYGVDVTDPQANPDDVRAALARAEVDRAEAAQASQNAQAENGGRGEAAVELTLAEQALREADRLDSRAADERVDASAGTGDDTDRSTEQSRIDQAAALELQAREYDQQADAGGTPTQNADELRELASDARAQAQLYRTDADTSRDTNAPQQTAQAGAEVNAASDQGRANAERSTGEVKYDSAERRTGMAAQMNEQGIPQETINVRMRHEVAQGRPATEAPAQGQHVDVPQTKRGRGANRSAERTQQSR
jgi:hypothetical protein